MGYTRVVVVVVEGHNMCHNSRTPQSTEFMGLMVYALQRIYGVYTTFEVENTTWRVGGDLP